jgi:hypothetical protein
MARRADGSCRPWLVQTMARADHGSCRPWLVQTMVRRMVAGVAVSGKAWPTQCDCVASSFSSTLLSFQARSLSITLQLLTCISCAGWRRPRPDWAQKATSTCPSSSRWLPAALQRLMFHAMVGLLGQAEHVPNSPRARNPSLLFTPVLAFGPKFGVCGLLAQPPLTVVSWICCTSSSLGHAAQRWSPLPKEGASGLLSAAWRTLARDQQWLHEIQYMLFSGFLKQLGWNTLQPSIAYIL